MEAQSKYQILISSYLAVMDKTKTKQISNTQKKL